MLLLLRGPRARGTQEKGIWGGGTRGQRGGSCINHDRRWMMAFTGYRMAAWDLDIGSVAFEFGTGYAAC